MKALKQEYQVEKRDVLYFYSFSFLVRWQEICLNRFQAGARFLGNSLQVPSFLATGGQMYKRAERHGGNRGSFGVCPEFHRNNCWPTGR